MLKIKKFKLSSFSLTLIQKCKKLKSKFKIEFELSNQKKI